MKLHDSMRWEWQHPKAAASVHPYAAHYLERLLARAGDELADAAAV